MSRHRRAADWQVYINIVMEYCDGGDLTRLIKGRKEKGELLSEDDIMDKFVQVRFWRVVGGRLQLPVASAAVCDLGAGSWLILTGGARCQEGDVSSAALARYPTGLKTHHMHTNTHTHTHT
jgi:hypothetical protein